ncbi:hypothetical protein [Leisingera sp. ANG-M7]|nr:hypothetical protein [Leisingera sp. ANG-M7]
MSAANKALARRLRELSEYLEKNDPARAAEIWKRIPFPMRNKGGKS